MADLLIAGLGFIFAVIILEALLYRHSLGPDAIADMRPLCRRCDEDMDTDSIDETRQRLHGPAIALPARPCG